MVTVSPGTYDDLFSNPFGYAPPATTGGSWKPPRAVSAAAWSPEDSDIYTPQWSPEPDPVWDPYESAATHEYGLMDQLAHDTYDANPGAWSDEANRTQQLASQFAQDTYDAAPNSWSDPYNLERQLQSQFATDTFMANPAGWGAVSALPPAAGRSSEGQFGNPRSPLVYPDQAYSQQWAIPEPPTVLPDPVGDLEDRTQSGARNFWGAVGTGAMEGLDLAREYVGKPAFGLASGLTEADRKYDPETGQWYRESAGIGDVVRGIGAALTSDPRDTYSEARRATDEYLADPNKPEWYRFAAGELLDPTWYIGAPAVKAAAGAARGTRAAGLLDTLPARAAVGLLENPRWTAASGIGAGAAATEAVDRLGLEGLPAAGLTLGATVLGAAAGPSAVRAGARGVTNLAETTARGASAAGLVPEGGVPGGGMVRAGGGEDVTDPVVRQLLGLDDVTAPPPARAAGELREVSPEAAANVGRSSSQSMEALGGDNLDEMLRTANSAVTRAQARLDQLEVGGMTRAPEEAITEQRRVVADLGANRDALNAEAIRRLNDVLPRGVMIKADGARWEVWAGNTKAGEIYPLPRQADVMAVQPGRSAERFPTRVEAVEHLLRSEGVVADIPRPRQLSAEGVGTDAPLQRADMPAEFEPRVPGETDPYGGDFGTSPLPPSRSETTAGSGIPRATKAEAPAPPPEPTPARAKDRTSPVRVGDKLTGPDGAEYAATRAASGAPTAFVQVKAADGTVSRLRRSVLDRQPRQEAAPAPKAKQAPIAPPKRTTARTTSPETLWEAPMGAPMPSAAAVAPPSTVPLPAAAGSGGKPPKGPRTKLVKQPDTPEFKEAARAILDATDAEVKARKSGEIGAAIREGRKGQAERIRAAAGPDATAADISAAMSAGGKGSLSKSIEAPRIALTPKQDAAVRSYLAEQLAAGDVREFEYANNMAAFEHLKAGERLEPRELAWVREEFGDEVADAVSMRTKTAAQVKREEAAELAKAQRLAGAEHTRVMREAEAARKALAEAEAKARAREVRFSEQAQRTGAKVFEDLQSRDASRRKAMDSTMAKGERALERVAARQAKKLLVAQQKLDAADARKAEAHAKRMESGSYAGRVSKAKAELRKVLAERFNMPESEMSEFDDIVDHWLETNPRHIDAHSEHELGALWGVRSMVTGEVKNPRGHRTLTQGFLLKEAFARELGLPEDVAGDITRTLVDAELARIYGTKAVPNKQTKRGKELAARFGDDGTVPDHIAREGGVKYEPDLPEDLAAAIKAAREQPGKIAAGAQQASRDFKSIAYGMDVGVLGLQFLKTIQANGLPIAIGLANRVARIMGVGYDVSTAGNPRAIARQIVSTLDGLAPSGARSAIMDEAADATILRHLPFIRRIDPKVAAGLNRLFQAQARITLTPARNLAYEGHLLLSRAAGNDISDPNIRRMIAERVNAASAYSRGSVQKGRAAREAGLLLTPSMRRAMVKEVAFMATAYPKLLATAGTSPQARAAAMYATGSILSYGISTLVMAKVLHDTLGMEGTEFEWDPSKPGFGRVTLANGLVISVFPQQQVATALARAIRHASQGEWGSIAPGPGEGGVIDTALKLGIGSASPVVSSGLKAGRFGFDPVQGGWALGEWGQGMDWKDASFSVLPVPPWAQTLYFDPPDTGTDLLSIGLDIGGLSNFEENEYYARNRQLVDNPDFDDYRKKGAPDNSYENLSPEGQKKAREELGVVESRNPETRKRQERAAEIRAAAAEVQTERDRMFREGTMDAKTYRAVNRDSSRINGARIDELWQDIDFPDDPADPLNKMRKAYEAATDPVTDELDWEAIDRFYDRLSAEDRRYIERNTGLYRSALQREGSKVADRLDKTGFFKLYDDAWYHYTQQNPQFQPYETYQDWEDAWVDQQAKTYIDMGHSRQVAFQRAAQEAGASSVARGVSKMKNGPLELQWLTDNYQLAYEAWVWGYFTPTKEQRAWFDQLLAGGYIKP